MINFVWCSLREDVPKKGYWDQGTTMHMLEGHLCRFPAVTEYFSIEDVPLGEGAIVWLPSKAHDKLIDQFNQQLQRLAWVVLILGEDECGEVDCSRFQHPNMRIWSQMPWPQRWGGVQRGYIIGAPYLARQGIVWKREKPLDWFFAGQVTHRRRRACVDALRDAKGKGLIIESREFAGGIPYSQYMGHMQNSKVVLCPSGMPCPDSFRAWETLEAGGIPIVDVESPLSDRGYPLNYFDYTCPGHCLPTIHDYSMLPELISGLLSDWQYHAARVGGWWSMEKRVIRDRLLEDAAALGWCQTDTTLAGRVTVIIPSSPIPSHPSVAYITETINSIRKYPELTEAEILITCDGVREEQQHMRQNYYEYVRNLLFLCNNGEGNWRNVHVSVHDSHLHQVEMARRVLEKVNTEYILYVEHDTPLVGEIPWEQVMPALDVFQVVRFYHDVAIPKEHEYLHKGYHVINDIRYRETVQWSQRPHLARTAYYRQMLRDHFSPNAITFIEDKMHSVAQRIEGHKIGIYCPEGDIRRSYHTDGRAQGPKFDDKLIF